HPHLPSPVRATARTFAQNQEHGKWMVPLAGLEPARCCHHLILSQVWEVSRAFPWFPGHAKSLDYKHISCDGDCQWFHVVLLWWFHGGSTREKHGKSAHKTHGGRGPAQRSGIFPLGRRVARVRAASPAVWSEELRCQVSAWAGPPCAGASRDHWQA